MFIYLDDFNFQKLIILKNNKKIKKIIFSLILINILYYDLGLFNRFNIYTNYNKKQFYINKIRKFLKFCSNPNIILHYF